MARPRIVVNAVLQEDTEVEIGTIMQLVTEPYDLVIVTDTRGTAHDEFSGVVLESGESYNTFVYDQFHIFKGTVTLSQGV